MARYGIGYLPSLQHKHAIVKSIALLLYLRRFPPMIPVQRGVLITDRVTSQLLHLAEAAQLHTGLFASCTP
jgi:hypothetical protein